MSEKRFDVNVLEHFCKGCGLCVEVCSAGKLQLRDKPDRRGIQTVEARPDVDCTGCLQCATMCPDTALEIVCIRDVVGARSGAQDEPSEL